MFGPTGLFLSARVARLALVHDYLLVLRGAERTFAAMADLWPEAPIVTLLYDEDGTERRFGGHDVVTSPLQRLRLDQNSFRVMLAAFPTATRRLDLSEFDCIVSSSSAFAHGVRKRPGAKHVCYCHSPFRYAWHERERTLSDVAAPLRTPLSLVLRRHRNFDRRAAQAVDLYVANSEITKERIRRFWGRDAEIVHPPVDVERFRIGAPGEHLLFVGELVGHKRPEVAIEAAAAAGRPIRVVGAGPELERLRERYRGQAEFLGRVGDAELVELYSQAAALVVPNVEEFGIAAVEAQASGRPVVAIDAGGARETVVRGRTGLLVPEGDPAALARALREDMNRFDPHEIRAHAQGFSRERFQARLRELVEAASPSAGPR
jgi:glycosyltransferase involved in cell wall biosynthesis